MTPMLATPTPTPAPDYTAIAKRHKDGSVLLSVNAEKMCRVNGVGALVRLTIEESRHTLTVVPLPFLNLRNLRMVWILARYTEQNRPWKSPRCPCNFLKTHALLGIPSRNEVFFALAEERCRFPVETENQDSSPT